PRNRCNRLRLDTLEDRAAPDSLLDVWTMGVLGGVFGLDLPTAAIRIDELARPTADAPSEPTDSTGRGLALPDLGNSAATRATPTDGLTTPNAKPKDDLARTADLSLALESESKPIVPTSTQDEARLADSRLARGSVAAAAPQEAEESARPDATTPSTAIAPDATSPETLPEADPTPSPSAVPEPAATDAADPPVAGDQPIEGDADAVVVRSAIGGADVRIDARGKRLEAVRTRSALPAQAGGVELPLGLFAFNVTDVAPGGIAAVDLTLPANTRFDAYYKQNPATKALERFDYDGATGAVFHGSTVTLYLQDGGRGDMDGLANGVIVDPGGPGVAVGDAYTILHDGTLEVDLLANDTDPEGDPLEVVFVSEPSHGTLDFQAVDAYGDGRFIYRPTAKYVGTDSFTYKVSDGTSESAAATVTITVTNQTPAGGADSYTGTGEDYAIAGNVQGNDADADGDPILSLVATTTSHGTLNLRDDGSFTYTPNVNYAGADSFTYTLTDGIATSNPIAVSLTVPLGGPFDLDGNDRSTQTSWISEPDQVQYGLGVSTSDSATILARVYNVPSNMVIDSRRILFNPNVLSVNGVTQPGYVELSPSGANEVLTVTALATGYGASEIRYEVLGHYLGGPPFQGFTTLNDMQVVENKAVLRHLEFTSDHNDLRENNFNPTASGKRYDPIEFVRATKYNAPMTQTMTYAGAPSKMKVKVTWDWAGIPADTPFKLVGTSAEAALQFDSGLYNTGNLPGAGFIEVTATNDVGSNIRTINGAIEWKMVLNPNAASPTVLPMGTSGAHTIYVLFGKPIDQEKALHQATDIRMKRTVELASQALAAARAAAPVPNQPTWQRVAYHTVQLQQFNVNRNRVQIPLTDSGLEKGWLVRETWNEPSAPGADCISGASYAWLVLKAAGMPGTYSVDAFAAKSETRANASLFRPFCEQNAEEEGVVPAGQFGLPLDRPRG
ncbi:MAG TPA: Ig-like domain-containing protein, partial [Gemmataceae bacterium]|nr:Ig-like domain-containing protein [Gemmataceae bacterium]